MTSISGISDFLKQSGSAFKIFDMGRRILPLDEAEFLAFEEGSIPYPFPLQQQAWLGIMVWNTLNDKEEMVIWFVRFPLDAKGLLTPTIREDFIVRLIEREGKQDEENPYGFKPKQEHMAVFHAKAAKLLNKPASRFYEHALDYFRGETGYDQWAFVGFQGIADLAARLDEDDNNDMLSRAIGELPPQPLDALCQCLEHEAIEDNLALAIAEVMEPLLANGQDNANLISLCLRGISFARNQQLVQEQVFNVLASTAATNPEVLASISGRCWETLKSEQLMLAYLENLARCPEGQEFFNLVVVDIINIPGMSEPLHQAIRNPQRSELLSTAIGGLFKQFS